MTLLTFHVSYFFCFKGIQTSNLDQLLIHDRFMFCNTAIIRSYQNKLTISFIIENDIFSQGVIFFANTENHINIKEVLKHIALLLNVDATKWLCCSKYA